MFLIGDTPPAIRRKHFEEMTQDNNFATIYEFAKHAVNQPEEESIKLLKDYYLKHEPTIESVSSFKDVYSTRPRRFLDDSNSPNFKTNVTGSEPNLLLPGPKSQKSENKSGRLKASSSAVATKNTKDRDNNFTKRLKEEREKLRAGEPSQSTASKASRPNKPRNVKRNMIRQTSKPLRKISARENSASYCRSSTSSDENSDWIPSTLPEKLTPPSLVGGSRRRQESRSILDIFDPDEPFDQKLSTPDRKSPDLMDMVLSNQRSYRRSDQLDSQTQISLDDDRSSLVKSEDRTYDDLLDEQNFLSPKRAKRKDSYSVLDDFLNMTSHERRGNENSYTNAEMRNMHFLSDEDETSDKEVSIIDELMG